MYAFACDVCRLFVVKYTGFECNGVYGNGGSINADFTKGVNGGVDVTLGVFVAWDVFCDERNDFFRAIASSLCNALI